ncbi:MAG: hypothetical protein ONB24_04265 [candidate division KSB1 bacterium]|nr:hypothetical protein [candidate division KSB1 bacterium]
MMRTKRRIFHFWALIVILFILVTSIYRCDIDHGLAPLPGTLNLTVYFRNTPPKNTQGIYLMVAPKFPPHAINEVYHSPNSLPIDQDTVFHQLALPYGHYDALALWWYSKDVESNLADVLAIPIDYTSGLKPLGFDITPEKPVVDIQLPVNWAKVDRDAAIEGTVYFSGPFPKDTDIVAVAAFKSKPVGDVDYLIQLKSLDFSIKMNQNPYKYRLPVRSGSVGYIAVFWLPEHAGLNEFSIAGEYKSPEDSTRLGSLRLKPGDVAQNVDIFVDWKKMKRLGE